MKTLRNLLLVGVVVVMATSCKTMKSSMETPNNRVEFEKNDFEFSERVTGEATQQLILGIDFDRLFTKKHASIDKPSIIDIPVIGDAVDRPTVSNFALFNITQDNSGYDVIFYPSYETTVSKPIIGLPIYIKKEATVKARLGKLK